MKDAALVTWEVLDLMGRRDDTDLEKQVASSADTIRMMAYAYTRGGGFNPLNINEVKPDVFSVLVTATARLVANPEQIRYQVGALSMNEGFRGWSLAERAVLDRYRRKAA
ncbi:hypothetical protein MHY20_00120 [Helcobacillus sp. ACRRO]|uniref:hypothetical protein n=1 Tax=Helcobacillus sp. ACRRO TaxID=2918202 RepID=UPI001EF621B4|nr:hypothetical protein [Helcobacillus sp. ACRRO]MCG7426036.1 hypothetical protein [Helcobacillus sp. ACRRO]